MLVALLAGCSTTPDPSSPGSSQTSTPTSTAPSGESAPDEPSTQAPTPEATAESPAPAPSLLVHVSVESGSVVAEVVDLSGGPTVASPPDGDTGTVLTVVVEDPAAPVILDVPEAVGGSVQVAADRTAAVLHADGRLALGLALPKAEGTNGTQARVRWVETAEGAQPGDGPSLVLDVSAVDPAVFPLVVTTQLGASVVASASWGDREGGRSLAVTPTDWGRVSGATGSATAWADLLAVEPEADTPGMETQLQCHLLGARDKATWNLEPWRPDLGLVEYALARCNPT
ncbi:DUF2599 domain-containing protein [Sanguibacter keddieii]|uniref:DUF2599 domain-containing protein n=1 Tax=Sanguibacter keddieii TaxID=60920 RepID=UPI0001B83A16|nr:DUF2599 domain-containing protein [Sanguibacter keddieii]